MTKQEYSGFRDLTYSRWHRTLPSFCLTTNIDWVEVRNNDEIAAIIEDKDDRSRGIGIWQAKVMQKIANNLGVPFYVVFHNCAYAKEEVWKFNVLDMKTKVSRLMNKKEYEEFIKKLGRTNDVCKA